MTLENVSKLSVTLFQLSLAFIFLLKSFKCSKGRNVFRFLCHLHAAHSVFCIKKYTIYLTLNSK